MDNFGPVDIFSLREVVEPDSDEDERNPNRWRPPVDENSLDPRHLTRREKEHSARAQEGDDDLLIEEGGFSTLHYAACHGEVYRARIILDKYPRLIHPATDDGDTALHLAVQYAPNDDSSELIALLITRGAHVNARNNRGETPLHLATRYGLFNAATTLLDAGADVNSTKKAAVDVADFEYNHPEGGATGKNSVALMGLFSALALQSNQPQDLQLNVERAEENVTPMHGAVDGGHLNIAKLLLERGANPGPFDKDAGTPLHIACHNGSLEICRLLLAQPGVKNGLALRSKCGWVPLHAAARGRGAPIVRILLDAGAQVDAVADGDREFEKGMTALALACEASAGHDMTDAISALLEHGADPNHAAQNKTTPLFYALTSGKLPLARLLLEKGADKSRLATMLDPPPLMVAAAQGNAEICKFLLEEVGVNVNVKSRDHQDYTPLHHAAGYGRNRETIELLVKAGANIEAKLYDGRRPVHMACFKGDKEALSLLADLGADIECEDLEAWTPLHYAAYYGHMEVVSYLLRPISGANVPKGKKRIQLNRRTIGGPGFESKWEDCTAADLARMNGKLAVMERLLLAGDTLTQRYDDSDSLEGDDGEESSEDEERV